MPYIPNTDDDRRKMLDRIGVSTFDDLLRGIPDQLRLQRPLDIPALSEVELLADIGRMARKGKSEQVVFAGGGVYDHFIPSAVKAVVSRPEFMTAYTPYQAEVSQGTLQVIYEFQTHICRLTGMEVANASMYDGATAAAEAVIVSAAATRRSKVVVLETVNPLYREVIKTYLSGRGIELVTVPSAKGTTDPERLKGVVDEDTACVLVGQPNFFGYLEDVEPIEKLVHESGAKLVMTVDPIAAAILRTPGELGADIVVGEGQPLGVPLSFGGPLFGFFAATKKLVRNIPGRLSGRTVDVDGKPGFVLTLQTREQHIRREKATSNICTNSALLATTAAIYLSLMGKTGLKKVALLSAERAQAVSRRIGELDGYEPFCAAPFVREFAVKTPRPARDIIQSGIDRGVLPGVNAGRWFEGLDDCLIVALTEKRTAEDIDRLIEVLKE